jgi:hypothetical protein
MMKATCGKCGGKAEVTLAANGFSYDMDRRARSECVVIRERMAAEGGSTNNTDCDHMLEAAQAVRERFLQRRV